MDHINEQALRHALPGYREFLASVEGQQWAQERASKDNFIARYFSEETIDALEEGTLRELIHILWSFNGWTNKDWLFQQMLTSELPRIRTAFRRLLYGHEPLAQRFDGMRGIRMVGAAFISEMLAHHNHREYAIWNRRSREGLVRLGISETVLPKSSQISGKQYASFCGLAKSVLEQVSALCPDFRDLFHLDFLLYYVSAHEPRAEVPVPTPKPIEDFDHGAVIDQVLELGDGLGFEVAREFTVARGCRIDAIWRSRVANLGAISYAFEVHRSGSRDSAILNLQRVRRDPTIQKVVLVSSSGELERFREEIASLGEDFRNAVGYFTVEDLERALEHLDELKGILRGLGLLATEAVVG